MKIWIVEGHARDYEDAHEWQVAAYFSEEKAELRRQVAQDEGERIDSLPGWDYGKPIPREKNKYDKDAGEYERDARYIVYSMDIEDADAIVLKGTP